MIDTTKLKRRYGFLVKERHFRALNKLTIPASQGTDGSTTSLAYAGCGTIPSKARVIHQKLLEYVCKNGHLGSNDLQGSDDDRISSLFGAWQTHQTRPCSFAYV